MNSGRSGRIKEETGGAIREFVICNRVLVNCAFRLAAAKLPFSCPGPSAMVRPAFSGKPAALAGDPPRKARAGHRVPAPRLDRAGAVWTRPRPGPQSPRFPHAHGSASVPAVFPERLHLDCGRTRALWGRLRPDGVPPRFRPCADLDRRTVRPGHAAAFPGNPVPGKASGRADVCPPG